MQWKPANMWVDDNEDEDAEKESQMLNYGFLWRDGCFCTEVCLDYIQQSSVFVFTSGLPAAQNCNECRSIVTSKSHEFQYDCSDWGHIAKNQTCIWCRRIYGSGPNWEVNWKDKIPCDLCCSHKKRDLSCIWAKKQIRSVPLLPAVWSKPMFYMRPCFLKWPWCHQRLKGKELHISYFHSQAWPWWSPLLPF